MADMRKEFPAQQKGRRTWILETVREHQAIASDLLDCVIDEDWEECRVCLSGLYKQDRDALLQPDGILTARQVEKILTERRI